MKTSPSPPPPSVTAIIVNYKSAVYAKDCIDSLIAQNYPGLDIVVVDNASGGKDVELLRTSFGHRINLVENPENTGFGRANNLAATRSEADYLLLVNPDARLLQQDFIERMVNFMARNPEIGIAGPEVHEPLKKRRQYSLPHRYYPVQNRLRNQDFIKALPGPYAWILGACLCIRRDLYEKLGGFDPDYFLYGEDTDICIRVRKAGYAVGYYPGAKMTHIGGASESSAIPLEKFLRKKRGIFLFYSKHYPKEDVIRIARMTLASSYYAALKNWLRIAFRLDEPHNLQSDRQKIEATRMVCRETLDALQDRSRPA
ncbi:MAG: glycosyltransferase family 2 protein [Azonexus sp.]|jgi:GT2 family glycosyltransferase|uniref:glycosyltransferase family 2 protein n=1 Tax=Azonexus sp. TaxID=1872668 RepID=UPI00282E7DEE|nr:glycosyltransferase family 2 protein [Azonexus sp.]MDR0775990.1 glycosyltransferase family 2 protein [Azonexus sp.]